MDKLPNCDCVSCRVAVAKLAEPVRVMSVSEATAWNRAYADARRKHLTFNPPLTRDQIALRGVKT